MIRSIKKFIIRVYLGLLTLGFSTTIWAQDSSATRQPVIDDISFSSTRDNAMGGALGTLSDDIDSLFINPSGIGGIMKDEKSDMSIRKLYFPYSLLSINKNTESLRSKFGTTSAATDVNVGKSLVDATAGEHQFGRANIGLGLVLGRSILLPFIDTQMAMVATGDENSAVDTLLRTTYGVGFGGSAKSSDGSLRIGYFGYYAFIEETSAIFNYDTIVDPKVRSQALDETSKNYSGLSHNFGLAWIIKEKNSPTFGINLSNIGNANFKSTSDETEYEESDLYIRKDLQNLLTYQKDISISLAISPMLNKMNRFNFSFLAKKLYQENLEIAKKLHLGAEYTYGNRPGSYANIALRAGYSFSGFSYGAMLNIGLIAIELASSPVDIGLNNNKEIDRRFSANIIINVSEF